MDQKLKRRILDQSSYEVDDLLNRLELDGEVKFPDCPELEKATKDTLKTKARSLIDMNLKLMDQKSFMKPALAKVPGSVSSMI
jgi:hypothetical protein